MMSFVSFFFFRSQRVNFCFFPFFFFGFDTKKCFYRHLVLPYAIEVLIKAGYKLVTVAECLGESPYLRVDAPSARDVRFFFFFFFWHIF